MNILDPESRYYLVRIILRTAAGFILIWVIAKQSWLPAWAAWPLVLLVGVWVANRWAHGLHPRSRSKDNDELAVADEDRHKRVAYNLGRRATSRDQNPWDGVTGSAARWRYSGCWIAGYCDKQWRPDEWQYPPMSRSRLLWWRLKLWAFGPRRGG